MFHLFKLIFHILIHIHIHNSNSNSFSFIIFSWPMQNKSLFVILNEVFKQTSPTPTTLIALELLHRKLGVSNVIFLQIMLRLTVWSLRVCNTTPLVFIYLN